MPKEMRTMLDFFNNMRETNTFDWSHDYVMTHAEPGHVKMEFTTNPQRHVNFKGAIHGGVYATFSDILMGVSCFSLRKKVVTLELKGNFIKTTALGNVLYGEAKVEHNGRSTMVLSCHIYDEQGTLLYMASGTFFVIGEFELPDLPWSE